jgi:hypothetical protein
MSDSEFNFDLYAVQLLDPEGENDNIIKRIVEAKEKYCNDSDENKETLMKLMTTYVCGELDEENSKKAIQEIEELLDNNEFTKKIYELFDLWIVSLKNDDSFNDDKSSKKLSILNTLLSNSQNKSFALTKLIWSIQEFRNLIQLMPLGDSGKKVVENGVFRSLYSNSKHNYQFDKSLDAVSDLISDESLYPYIVKYIYNIIKLNEPYLSLNFMANVAQKNCSQVDFNIFIFKFLRKMYESYFNSKENKRDKEQLFKDLKLQIKDYNIENLELPQQIFVTMMYGLHVFLGSFYKLYDSSRTTSKNYVSIIKTEINKEYIQNIFIEYDKFHNNFKIETVYTDIVFYYDFILAYKKKDKFNANIKTQIYRIISDILGGKSKNVHTRYLAFSVIKGYSNEVGFIPFEQFFDNLFKYINEVSFEKLAFPYLKDKIAHQHALTNALFQMTDVCKKEDINERSKYIFPQTIFRMISNSFSIFDNFSDDLFENIKSNMEDRKYYRNLYDTTIQLSLYTLLIYENLYERKIVEKIYPETEEKFLLLVGRILSNIYMKTGNKFQLHQNATHFQNANFETELVKKCVEIIKDRINKKSGSIIDIKEKISKYIPHVNTNILSEIEKNIILESLEVNYKEEIQYPSEFTDPITCKPIITPVMIPNINEIFERISVVTQIYNQGINPYTREPLTLEELEKYNSKEDIIKKINEFQEEKNKWLHEENLKKKSMTSFTSSNSLHSQENEKNENDENNNIDDLRVKKSEGNIKDN